MFTGSENDPTKCSPAALAVGRSAASFNATGSSRLTGTLLFGYGAPVVGSRIVAATPEKSPPSCACIGGMPLVVERPCRIFSLCPVPNRKILFLTTGPPPLNPNWF